MGERRREGTMEKTHQGTWPADGSSMLLTTPSRNPDSLKDARLGTVFQPVVSLDTGEVLGAEALMRANVDGRDVSPLAVITQARYQGRLAILDLAALEGAVTAASSADGGVLLVNVEPSTLALHLGEVIAVLDKRAPGLHVVVEVTERALAADPAGLLRATEELHAKGYPIALDDVGTNPQSLALLEVIRPRIVKLDMAMLRDYADQSSLHVAGAVAGYAEMAGAFVVAVGIETQEDVMRAKILGAHLGQGSFLGRPQTDWAPQVHDSPLRFASPPASPPRNLSDTPFSLITRHRETHIATRDMLLPMSLAVEATVAQSHLPAVLLASVQDARDVPTSTRARFERLSATMPLVGVVGMDVTQLGLPSVHLADAHPGDPLCREWNVVALGAQTAVALTARELPVGASGERTYEFTTTRDRALVVAAAATLIARLGV